MNEPTNKLNPTFDLDPLLEDENQPYDYHDDHEEDCPYCGGSGMVLYGDEENTWWNACSRCNGELSIWPRPINYVGKKS